MLITSQISLVYSKGISHQTEFVILTQKNMCQITICFHIKYCSTDIFRLTFAETQSKYQNYLTVSFIHLYFILYLTSNIRQIKCYIIEPIFISLLISAYMWHPTQNWYFASMTTALSRRMHCWGTAGENHDDLIHIYSQKQLKTDRINIDLDIKILKRMDTCSILL